MLAAFTGKPTLQSWKCSDWSVSWTTSFSLGVPGWAVAEEEEEEAAVKPSNTFLILNFFIFFRWRRDDRKNGSSEPT